METLFVYCSADESLNSLCRESAFKRRDARMLELRGDSQRSFLKKLVDFFCIKQDSSACAIEGGVSHFDRIIIACDEFAGELPSEIRAFIKNNDFRYKTVDCMIFGTGKRAMRAKDNLKVIVSLSGGTVRSALSVSPRELKREDEDILFSLRHRIAV